MLRIAAMAVASAGVSGRVTGSETHVSAIASAMGKASTGKVPA